ncbi:MAG: monovalent cation/H+ antiporter complex subunit F [Verrucomicrobiota bacterium]
MMSTPLTIAVVALVLIILIPFYRLWKGPTVFDRLLSIAAIAGKVMALILLLGLGYGRLSMFVDIALGYAVLNFIAGIAMAEYFRLREHQK